MSRAAYNDTATFYAPLAPFTPWFPIGTEPCRVVFRDDITVLNAPCDKWIGYVTYPTTFSFAGAFALTANGVDLQTYLNPVVQFGSLPGVSFHLVWEELVTRGDQVPYRRSWLIGTPY